MLFKFTVHLNLDCPNFKGLAILSGNIIPFHLDICGAKHLQGDNKCKGLTVSAMRDGPTMT